MKRSLTKFRNLLIHDDILADVRVRPAVASSRHSTMILSLHRPWKAETIEITFRRCANASVQMDFDVLRDNASFGNADRTGATDERSKLKRMITGQKRFWNVDYDKGMELPIDAKLRKRGSYTLFRVEFFGGVIEILAGSFSASIVQSRRPDLVELNEKYRRRQKACVIALKKESAKSNIASSRRAPVRKALGARGLRSR